MSELKCVLDALQEILPPSGLIYVGGGDGDALIGGFRWPLRNMVVIDADATMLESWNRRAADHRPDRLIHAMLWSESGVRPYYRYSNERENGGLSAAALSGVWRNLKTVDELIMPTVRLFDLLNDEGVDGSKFDWLVVDCMPGLEVLAGSGDLIESLSVLVLRCTNDRVEGAWVGTRKKDLVDWLRPKGFKLAFAHSEFHPGIEYVVCCRDWAASAERFRLAADAASVRYSEALSVLQQSEIGIAELNQRLDSESKVALERATQLADLRQQYDMARSDLAACMSQLQKQRDLRASDIRQLENSKMEGERLLSALADEVSKVSSCTQLNKSLQNSLDAATSEIAQLDLLRQRLERDVNDQKNEIISRDSELKELRDAVAAHGLDRQTLLLKVANAEALHLRAIKESALAHAAGERLVETFGNLLQRMLAARDQLKSALPDITEITRLLIVELEDDGESTSDPDKAPPPWEGAVRSAAKSIFSRLVDEVQAQSSRFTREQEAWFAVKEVAAKRADLLEEELGEVRRTLSISVQQHALLNQNHLDLEQRFKNLWEDRNAKDELLARIYKAVTFGDGSPGVDGGN